MNEAIETLRELAKTNGKHIEAAPPPARNDEPATRLPARSIELPPDRAAAVEYGLTQFQTLGHERDELRKENTDLKDTVAALHIQCEGLQSQLAEAQSHIRSAMLIRDQSMADRIKYEALFVSVQAQLRAFAVPAEPLIRDSSEDA